MGNQSSIELSTEPNIELDAACSLLVQCEKAIIQSYNNFSIPKVIIDMILQYSEHWKWQEYEPVWSETEKRKSKYLIIYDIHLRQLRLRLRNRKRKIKSTSALKSTHFNRFEYPLDTNRRRICFTLNFFRYQETISATNCPVLEGFIHIGFISNMYCTFNGKKLYKTYSKNEGVNGMLSNGQSFIGLSSRVVFDENIYGLYLFDIKNTNGKSLKDDAPIKYDEQFEIVVDIDNSLITFIRLFARGKDGKPRHYQLHLPQPMNRFKKEQWYPMIAINPYKSRFLETGCQISKGMML